MNNQHYRVNKRLSKIILLSQRTLKELKLISQQFIYDITKSDFTYYYMQNLELVKLVLRKQWEIIDKDDDIDENDLHK